MFAAFLILSFWVLRVFCFEVTFGGMIWRVFERSYICTIGLVSIFGGVRDSKCVCLLRCFPVCYFFKEIKNKRHDMVVFSLIY